MSPRLRRRRARAHASLLAAVSLTCAVFALVLCGLATATAQRADDATSQGLAAPPSRDAAVQFSATSRLADDVEEAEAYARRAETLGLDVTASVTNDVDLPDGQRRRAASYPTLPDLATLSAGRWADADDEATLPDVAAERLGVDVGDQLRLGPRTVTVVGTWTPDDAYDPRWFGDPSVSSGVAVGVVGPIVVSDRTLTALPDFRTSQWTITVPADATRDDLEQWSTDVPALLADADDSGVEMAGGLGARIATVARVGAGIDATGLVCLVLTVVLGAATLWQVAGALRSARAAETTVLRARGASRLQMLDWHGVDALAAGLAGAAVGAGVSWLAVGTPSAAVVGLVAAVVVATTLARAWPTMPVRLVARAAERSSIGGIVVVSAAVLATLRVLTTGDLVIVDDLGAVTPDALGVLAPALLMLAAGVVAVALARPVLGGLARAAAQASDRLALVLGLRLASRRARAEAATATLAALIVGGLVTASATVASTEDLVARTEASAVGADVRVDLDVAPTVSDQSPPVEPATYAELPGVTGARTAIAAPIRVADVQADLVAVAPSGADDAPAEVSDGAVAVDLTTDLADTVDLVRGDRFDVLIPDANVRFTAEVRRIADALPGLRGRSGMVADQASVQAAHTHPDAQLAVNTLLLDSTDPRATVDAVPAVSDRPVAVTTADAGDGALVRVPWRWVLVAVAAIGAIGVAAVVVSGARRGRRDAAVLRALGASATERVRALLGEVGYAAALGVVAGLVAAAVVVFAVVPALASSLVAAGSPDVGFALALDGPMLGIAAGVLVVASLAVGVVASRVLRTGGIRVLREDER